MNKFIPYGRQEIDEDDIDEVVKVLRSDFLTQGPAVVAFEKDIAEKVSARFSIAFNSATSALHVACKALNVEEQDIVWTSPISFVASANCARYLGAKIDFVDIDIATGLISVEELTKKLEQAKKSDSLPKALIAVHLAGASCNMEAIRKLSLKYNFSVIEDASHAIGGKYQGDYVGCCKYSDVTVFSFHPVKIITSGEGGIAVTNDSSIENTMRKLCSHGIEKNNEKFIYKTTKPWIYEQQLLGYNYRMTDIHAALGSSQLKKVDRFIQKRHEIYEIYREELQNKYIRFLEIERDVYSSLHLAVILLESTLTNNHEKIFNYLRSCGVGVQLHYSPIHLQPYYRDLGFKEGDFPRSEIYSNTAISIPIYPGLQRQEQSFICEKILSGITQFYDK
tara:strand:- start:2024 stop:3202 length:1179 start_codon:yes stop_codon:yes gene_type:complete